MSLQRVLPVDREWALFDAATSRDIEARATAALPAHALMRRAGVAVARLARAIAPHARRVWIAAGPGNNGGDGLEAAIHLLRHGWQVEVTLVGDAAALPPDAADALARAVAAGVPIRQHDSDFRLALEAGDLAIDALLGIGASRAPQGEIAATIRALSALSQCRVPVLAVDVPSGLHAGTGNALGDACVVATHTLALLTLKPGLFTGSGRDHAGSVWFDSLGTDAAERAGSAAPTAWLSGVSRLDGAEITDGSERPERSESLRPARRHAQHKGSFGDVAVIGGAPGMTGAALLAARAAHAAGAGRVFVQLLQAARQALSVDLLHPELMFRADWSAGDPTILARSTVVCGCGGAGAVRAVMPRLLSLAHRLVLDADALNAVAADPTLAALLCARSERGLATVLTPHPLEAARLLGWTTAAVQLDRLQAAHSLAERWRCVVVLKGSGSVIAAPQRVARVNATGNATLASGGTGDVLAGWLAGRWAQAGAQQHAADVAARAVAEHGAAAEPVHTRSLRAADLIERLHHRAG